MADVGVVVHIMIVTGYILIVVGVVMAGINNDIDDIIIHILTLFIIKYLCQKTEDVKDLLH